jgi:hypothetical protein
MEPGLTSLAASNTSPANPNKFPVFVPEFQVRYSIFFKIISQFIFVDKKKLKEDIDQSIDKIAVNALVQS